MDGVDISIHKVSPTVTASPNRGPIKSKEKKKTAARRPCSCIEAHNCRERERGREGEGADYRDGETVAEREREELIAGEMKRLPIMLRSVHGLSCQFRAPWMIRTFSMKSNSGGDANERKSGGFFESADDFEQRIFSGVSENIPNTDSFYQKLDRLEKARGRSGTGSRGNDGNYYQFVDGLDERFNSLSDGMDGKLKKAATYFVHSDEIKNDDYAFRPDISFRPGTTYTPKDLDLTKPGIRKSFKRSEFEVTTKEVLRKADFRNVRFLANFITEAGIIIKRSKTRISAKAQRKVAREIKTARAFGLMPFTTMGTKAFVFGNTMEDLDEDYKFDGYKFNDYRPPHMAVESEEKEPIELDIMQIDGLSPEK